MTAQQPDTTSGAGPSTTQRTTKVKNGQMAKRVANIYHKFRNKLLNVTPSSETQPFESKRHCPLLNLPAELRNNIWEHALSDITLKAMDIKPHKSLLFSADERSKHATALLRTCRQIYAETASIPLPRTTFMFEYLYQARQTLSPLKPAQRARITTISLDFKCRHNSYHLEPSFLFFMHFKSSLLDYLPGLETLQIQIYIENSIYSVELFKRIVAALIEKYRPALGIKPGKTVRLLFINMKLAPIELYRRRKRESNKHSDSGRAP